MSFYTALRDSRHTSLYDVPVAQRSNRLRPLAQATREEHAEDKNRLRPVEFILDILSRGQYASANFVEDLFGGEGFINALRGAAQGVTGERKGDYEDVLFGRDGEDGLFGNISEEDRNFWQKALGFVGNVFLDPTTYIGLGPTKAARAAAKSFADDAVRAARGQIQNFDEVTAAIRGAGKDVGELARKDPRKAVRFMEKASVPGNVNDVARQMDEVWRDAYQRGLRMNKDEMLEATRKGLGEEKEALEAMGKSSGSMVAPGYIRDIMETGQGRQFLKAGSKEESLIMHWDQLSKRLEDLDNPELTKHLDRAGERSFRVLAKEFGRGSGAANALDKVRPRIEWIRKAIKAAPGGEKFTDAWWSVMNRGPIGAIRRMFGFHNAYQRLINNTRMKGVDRQAQIFAENQQFINRHWKKLGPEDRQAFVRATELAEQKGISPTYMADDARTLAKLGGDPERVASMLRAEDEMATRWRAAFENADSAEIRAHGTIEAYFPIYRKKEYAGDVGGADIASSTPAFVLARERTLGQNIELEAIKLKALFRGMDTKTATDLVRTHNLGDIVTDPIQAFYLRAHVQAKMEARIQMIREFKQFGININESQNIMKASRGVKGITEEVDTDAFNQKNFFRAISTGVNKLGLRPVNDAAFDGFLFDREVAAVLDRVSKVTMNEESMKLVRKGVSAINNSFKSIVTASGGFHTRNFMGVQMQGFLKFGPRWFLGKNHRMQAIVATEVALGGLDGPGMAAIRKSIGNGNVEKILSSRVGGYQIREYGELLMRNGVVSPTSRVASVDDLNRFQKSARVMNLMSPNNPLLRGSQAAGSRVDSWGRTQAFFMDLEDITKGQKGFANDKQIEWAKLEAKKWFYDYADLTEAEKTYMKGMMPFYTWLRKNTAQQILGVMEMPEMYAMIPKVKGAVEARGVGDDRTLYPEWWLEAGMFPIASREEGTVVYRPNFPYQEGLNILPFAPDEDAFFGIRPHFGDWWDHMVNSMNPLLKSLIELAPEQGYNTFFKEELPEHSRAPRSLRLMTKSPKLLGLMDWMGSMAGIDMGFTVDDGSANTDDRGRLMMNSKVARALDNHLPILNRLGAWLDFPVAVLEGLGLHIEKAVESATGAKDDYDGADELMRILSQTFGIKMDILDEDQRELNRSYEVWDMMQEQLQEREPNPRRSLRARVNQQRQFRRLGI